MNKNKIGSLGESSLHSAIKKWYAFPDDEMEKEVDGSIIDISRKQELIEIQTGSFYAIRDKLRRLVKTHRVRLVYPIPEKKWIVRVGKSGREISRRKSPQEGKLIDVCDELMYIPDLINDDNFILDVLLIREEELWRDDGEGSWRRKGVSIIDRKLVEVIKRVEFVDKNDFLVLLPEDLPRPFTNRDLSQRLGISVYKSRRITYCLKKTGTITQTGKKGNETVFDYFR